jgi:hypothetical protein
MNDIEWLEQFNRLKNQRDRALECAKKLYDLSYCGCAITQCTCGMEDTKKVIEQLIFESDTFDCINNLLQGSSESNINCKNGNHRYNYDLFDTNKENYCIDCGQLNWKPNELRGI